MKLHKCSARVCCRYTADFKAAGCSLKADYYLAARTYRKAGKTVKAGTCVPCVSRWSAYHNTAAGGHICYMSVSNAVLTSCGMPRCAPQPLTACI